MAVLSGQLCDVIYHDAVPSMRWREGEREGELLAGLSSVRGCYLRWRWRPPLARARRAPRRWRSGPPRPCSYRLRGWMEDGQARLREQVDDHSDGRWVKGGGDDENERRT